MKKVIFIDWNKTLSYSLFWEHLQDTGHPSHKHLAPIEQWLFVDNRDVIAPWMRGELSADDITERMGREIGVESSLIRDELRHSCERMQYSIDNLKDIVANIRKRGIKVVIATDNMDTFTRYTVPAMNLNDIFDGILNSYDMGCLKDDDAPSDKILFFDEYLKENGWAYGDAVLLDDSPDTSGKYAKLGFDRVLIDSPEKLRVTLENLAYED